MRNDERFFFFPSFLGTKTLLTRRAPDEYLQPFFRCADMRSIRRALPLTPSYHRSSLHTREQTPKGPAADNARSPSEGFFVAAVTAPHTHMCGIRGQGSRVVLGGLNGALCVITQTSSNPMLRKVIRKKKENLWQRSLFS